MICSVLICKSNTKGSSEHRTHGSWMNYANYANFCFNLLTLSVNIFIVGHVNARKCSHTPWAWLTDSIVSVFRKWGNAYCCFYGWKCLIFNHRFLQVYQIQSRLAFRRKKNLPVRLSVLAFRMRRSSRPHCRIESIIRMLLWPAHYVAVYICTMNIIYMYMYI